MRQRLIRIITVAAFVASSPAWSITPAAAQAPTPSAGADLSGPRSTVKRTPDGKPVFSGIWQTLNTAAWDLEPHRAQKGVPAGIGVVDGNEIPYQPWAAAKKKENFGHRDAADPLVKCYLPGVPRITYLGFPFQIFQTPGQLSFLYEFVHATRFVYTDGTPHPPGGHIDWWLGDSRAKWEGDTLVVDVNDFNDETWFDKAGNFHSDELHVVERYTPDGPDHLNYDVTVEDPKVFTRPWTMSMVLYRLKEKGAQLLDYECYGFDYERVLPVSAGAMNMKPMKPITVAIAVALLTVSSSRPALAQARSTPDGQPDVQGYWDAALTGTFDLTDPKTGGGRLQEILNGAARPPRPSRVVNPADGKIPYQPWAAARFNETASHVDDPTRPQDVDTQARCLPGGVPRETFHSQFRILQPAGYVVLLYDGNHTYRIIPLGGTPHPAAGVTLWEGSSRGHWEGNTLVVDVTNLNGKARMDMIGNFSSDRAHMVERYTFVDAKTMTYTVDVEDPAVYTRPWKIAAQMVRRDRPGYEIWEDSCHEGERSADRMILRGDAARDAESK